MKNEKKSLINEAIVDYQEILNAATENAKNKIANEFPDKFNKLVNEEVKRGKKTAKDSYVDNTETEEEDVESNNNKEEDTVMKDQNKKETAKAVVKENVNGNQIIANPKNALTNEEFNIAELDLGNDDSDNNEYLTMEEIEKELNDFEGGGEPEVGSEMGVDSSVGAEPEVSSDPMALLLDLKAKIATLIDTMGGGNEAGEETSAEFSTEPEGEPEQGFDNSGEEGIEEEGGISDEEIDAILNSQEPEQGIEEAHGVTYSSRRSTVAGRHTPNADYLSKGELDQSPANLQESKKLAGLIKENKELTKKVNTFIAEKKSLETINEKYKNVLGKYRIQLTEMAVFNTNLSHVNNLLVNEEFALTQNDKVNIISGFKTVKSINESQAKYTSFISELKTTKKSIVESIENKVVDSVSPSASLIVEKTIYNSNKPTNTVDRMLKVINTIERNKKK